MVLQNAVNKFSDLFTADKFETTLAATHLEIYDNRIDAVGTATDIPIYITSKGTYSVVINRIFVSAGSINGTSIGDTSPLDGTFTTLVGTTSIENGVSTDASYLSMIGNTIGSTGTDANIDINLIPKGAGNIVISGLDYPNFDGVNGQAIVTDGAGNLSFGLVGVPGGGTGLSFVTSNALLYGGGTSSLQEVGPLTNGQLLIGSTGNAPVASTLTAGSGIGISNAAGVITISTAGGGFSWVESTSDTQAMSVNTGYITRNATPANQVVYTLPATASIGETVQVFGETTGGWKIEQNAGQTIYFGTATTTTGVTGYIESTEDRDTIEVTCIGTDTEWQINDSVGNIDVV